MIKITQKSSKAAVHPIHGKSDSLEDTVTISQSEYQDLLSKADFGRLAGGVAHNMNNKIGGALGYLELVLMLDQEKGILPQDYVDKLDNVLKSLGSLRNATKGIMGKSRNMSKKDVSEIDLNQIVESELQFFEGNDTLGEYNVIRQYDSGLQKVSGVQSDLCQAVQNLISNGIEAMYGQKKEESTLKLKTENNGEFVELTVVDTGCGIDEADYDKVFSPAFTTKTDEKKHGRIGNGLGTDYVRRIVEEHDGRIDFQSEKGRFTAFRITLPAVQQPEKQYTESSIEREKSIKNAVSKTGYLPAFSGIINQLTSLVNRESSIESISNYIEKDSALSAKVLQMANSAFYGYGERVDSIRKGAVRIGADELKRMSFDILAYRMFKSKSRKFDMDKYWEKSILSANVAYDLANEIEPDSKEKAYTAGLVSDIGKLIITERFPEEYEATLDRYQIKELGSEHEKETFGLTHEQVAAMYLEKKVRLSDDVVEAVGTHHEIDDNSSMLQKILYVSGKLADMSDDTENIYDTAVQYLGINRDKCNEIYEKSLERVGMIQDSVL